MRAFLALLLSAALPAAAEVDAFRVGQHLMITAYYDDAADSFSNPVPEGEQHACFVVDDVKDSGLTLRLLSGWFQPWWSDTRFQAGTYSDTWFNSNSYLEHHPNAPPHAQLKRLFSAVANCPAGS